MNFTNIKEKIEYSQGGITSKVVSKENGVNVTLFCMSGGSDISEHTSTKKGIVYVLEGKGNFNLEGENIEMKEGVTIFMKENAVHSLKAEENTSFLLVLV